MEWGRNAASGAVATPRRRYGTYSILLALLAPTLVILAGSYLVSLPSDAPEAAETVATTLTLVAYGLVAPVLHLVGMGFAVAGLRSVNAGKVSSVIGLLLNIAMVAAGVFFGWIAASGIGAFT